MASTIFFLSFFLLINLTSSDFAGDQAECGDQLVGLAGCLPYVQGDAKSPTPDCCTSLKSVLLKSPKCLCVLIKDHDDPQLGLKINVTLAVSLPSTCGVHANVSECPKLLNLKPNSKDAQMFKQLAEATQDNANSDNGNTTSAGTTPSASANDANTCGMNIHLRGWSLPNLGVEMILLVLPLILLVG
ncbi:non-specific lipid transfer protein GPI-anchored 13-like [Dioscorea cayenensis subsp. rotundata]|uniref:Non-specific lipid transfer protein GPI-anchored 13-like n=1 Tax=Dioscorea cayennensis subsp. rotundata TaxID=55577 RepID=A0AB40CCF4_DIOCR|nr:non-specific lipid transfer protein GPI-anchored 13-like [Dioscorea cayenensis subsp. rotundata]